MFKNVFVCLVITFNKKIIQVEKQNGQTYFNIFNIFIETEVNLWKIIRLKNTISKQLLFISLP